MVFQEYVNRHKHRQSCEKGIVCQEHAHQRNIINTSKWCVLVHQTTRKTQKIANSSKQLFSLAIQVKFINLGGGTSRIFEPCMTQAYIFTVNQWPDLLHVSLGYHCRSDPVQVQSWYTPDIGSSYHVCKHHCVS